VAVPSRIESCSVPTNVSAQGSFRYGTVIRPLLVSAEYDLDNVTTLEWRKTAMTQKDLKQLYGGEIKEYAKAHGMVGPVEERNRCWRLRYSEEIAFHLDTLPCIAERARCNPGDYHRGVSPQLAALAVAITDRRHPEYERVTRAY